MGLSHLEFRVLVYLADRMNHKTGQLNPSPERLARDCGLDPDVSERSIRRAITRLESMGLVERVGSRFGGRGPGGRYDQVRQRYRLRGDMTSGQGGHDVHPKGGHDVPQNLGSKEPGKVNLPGGSTTRVEFPQNRNSTAPAHSYSRMRPFFAEVLAEDDAAEWVEGQGIRLESGKYLRTVQAARKFLDTPDPGSW
jgi:hypothetical protein